MLYGSSPLAHTTAEQLDLHPAMTVSSKIISVQTPRRATVVAGGTLFGLTGQCEALLQVICRWLSLPCPYRYAGAGAGKANTCLGRISMDMLHVDLSEIEDAGVGSPVTLWGRGMPVDEVAQAAGTVGYELLCAIAPRMQRVT